MSAPRRVDGPQSTDAARGDLHAEALAAISQACGLIELDGLLRHLVSTWWQLTQSQRVILTVHDDARRVIHAATVDRNGAIRLDEFELTGDSLLPDRLIRVADDSEGSSREDPEQHVHTSLLSLRPVGEVLLWGPRPLPSDLQTHLCQCTADLLIRAVENDCILRQAKLDALGEFAAGAGHEINNPIAAISGRAQLLLRDETDPQRRQHLLTIGAQSLRVRDMIGDTMLFARPPKPDPQQWNLTVIVSEVVSKFEDECSARCLRIAGERASDVPILADRTQLCVVISELLRNAIQASPDGAQIDVETVCETTSDERTWARLTIRDEGPGLSDEAREHLFDPFYSGRQAGRGSGFGLSKCWRIVTNHGGRIDTRESDVGMTLVIHWPTAT